MIVGVQNFAAPPTLLTAQGGADVAVASGQVVTCLTIGGATGTLAQQNPGSVIAVVLGVIAILLGATPPTALVIFYTAQNGTDSDSYTVPPALLTANATINVPLALFGTAGASQWTGASVSPLIRVNPTSQAVTCKNVGSRCVFLLMGGGS